MLESLYIKGHYDLAAELIEAREQQDIVENLSKYKDDPDVYIHYSDLNKIGINPKQGKRFETPMGIYGYPLKILWKDVQADTIPFASGKKYVHVYRLKGNFLTASKYSQHKFEIDLNKLADWSDFKAPPTAFPKSKEDGRNYKKENFDFLVKKSEEDAKKQQRTHDRQTMILMFLTTKMAEQQTTKEHVAVYRTNALKYLGYDGVIDDVGSGIIHWAEPTQSVVFSTKNIEKLAMHLNYRKPSDRTIKDHLTAKERNVKVRNIKEYTEKIGHVTEPLMAMLQGEYIKMEGMENKKGLVHKTSRFYIPEERMKRFFDDKKATQEFLIKTRNTRVMGYLIKNGKKDYVLDKTMFNEIYKTFKTPTADKFHTQQFLNMFKDNNIPEDVAYETIGL